jgi:hypothetical protein
MIPWTTNITKEELNRSWHPVWVADHMDDTRALGPTFDMMIKWCENNCTDQWTMAWYQDYLAYWFKINDDAVMFRMVWR